MVRFLRHCAWSEINHTAAMYTEQEESEREREREREGGGGREKEREREREREREMGALQVRVQIMERRCRLMVRHVEGERERDSFI